MEWQAVTGSCEVVKALQTAWLATLAVPVLGPTHEERRKRAVTWKATHPDQATVCFQVDGDGVLFEMLAAADTDSEFLAAAYRGVGPVAAVTTVAFRSDDSLLLPFTLTGRARSEVLLCARLLVRGPGPWNQVKDWAHEAQVEECPENAPRLEELLAAGYRDAVQVYEAPWRAGT